MSKKTFYDYSDPNRQKPEKPDPVILEDKHVANAHSLERIFELSKEFVKIRQLDFSFKYSWQGKGKWTR